LPARLDVAATAGGQVGTARRAVRTPQRGVPTSFVNRAFDNVTRPHVPVLPGKQAARAPFPRLQVSDGGVADSTRGRVRSPAKTATRSSRRIARAMTGVKRSGMRSLHG